MPLTKPPALALTLLAVAWALAGWGCGTIDGLADVHCAADTDCRSPQKCVRVTQVRAGTGACLASSGTTVCRPACTTCPPPSPCGCVCD